MKLTNYKLTTYDSIRISTSELNDIIWQWDLITNQVNWNENFYNLFCYKINNLPSWVDGIFPDDRDRIVNEMNACLSKKKKSWTSEFRYLKANYTIVEVYNRTRIFYDKTGQAIRMTGSMIDISDKKKLEQELKIHNDQLRKLFAYQQDQREKEKIAIAYEMHEQLGQELAAIHMTLRADMEKELSANETLYIKLGDVCKSLHKSINKIRKISFELYPSILKDIGLTEAILNYARKYSDDTNIPVFFSPEEEFTISLDCQLILYRTFQQVLAMIIEHGATEIFCTLRKEQNSLLFMISDDGKNFLKAEETKTSIELLSINERLSTQNGSLTTEVDWKEGTTFFITILSNQN